MQRPDRLDAVVAATAVVVAGAIVAGLGAGSAEWVFFSALLTGLAVVSRELVTAWQLQRLQRRRADAARATVPDEVAVEAVRRERARMAHDTAASLREHLRAVRDLASAGLDTDEARYARLIHARSRQASSELRRHLGLLRDSDPVMPAAGEVNRHPHALGSAGFPSKVWFPDLLVGTVVALVALTEAVMARSGEYGDRGWLSVAVTVAAAFTASWRRVAPARASLAAAGLFLAGAGVGQGVLPGLWLVGTFGLLLWGTLAHRGRGWADVGAGLALVAVAATSTMLTDPVNGPMTVAILAVLVAVAGATGVARKAASRNSHEAAEHEAAVELASGAAVSAERTAFARELHDVVSHAVGLIAMQAAAAEVSWSSDRPVALQAMSTIRDTAEETLADLDRLGPRPPHLGTPAADLPALLERVVAAGTPVEAAGLAVVPAAHLPVVYRMVQESLTNVLRHAPGARARVEIVLAAGATRVTVTDDGPGGPPSSERGYGLIGLRERLEYAGGTLQVGPGTDGGFFVEAVLPPVAGAAEPCAPESSEVVS